MPTPHRACLRACLVPLLLLAACAGKPLPSNPDTAPRPLRVQPTPRPVPLSGPSLLWTYPLGAPSFGGASVADVNADGVNDVAFATSYGDSTVRVLSGDNGRQLWAYHHPDPKRNDCYNASSRFIRTGNDPLRLIVPCSSDGTVLCFDAADGRLVWTHELGEGEHVDTPPCIADANNDGYPDITVSTTAGRIHVISTSGFPLRTLDFAEGEVQSGPIVQDINGDRVADLIAAGWSDFSVHAVNGLDRSDLWTVKTEARIYHAPSMGIFHGPNGKPFRAFAVASYDGKVRAIKGDSGQVLWTVNTNDPNMMSPTAMLDVDGDGSDSAIAASTRITLMTPEGRVRWAVHAGKNIHDAALRGVSIADLDADGHPDISYITYMGLFRVLDSRDGRVIYEFDAGELDPEGRDCANAPALADLNGDGRLDAFFVIGGSYIPHTSGSDNGGRPADKYYGTAVCLSGFPGKATPTNSWLMFRHDPQNTGNFATPLPDYILKHIR